LVPRRVLPSQALVIAISPLLDARFEKAVVDLAARGFDVAVLSPSPIPLVRRARRASTSVDLACRLWTLERNARAEALRRLGIAIVEWDPAEPLQAALVGLTGARRRRAAARGPGVVPAQVRYWALFGAIAGASALAAIGVASTASASVRLPWAPALATVGAAVALVAVAFAVRRPVR